MTLKAKRNIAIGGGTAVCAALAVLIVTRFAPESKTVTADIPKDTSEPSLSLIISSGKHEESEPIEVTDSDVNSIVIELPESKANSTADEIAEPEINSEVESENDITIIPPAESKTEFIETNTSETQLTEIEIEKENSEFIEDGGIEIEQNFPEPEVEIPQYEPPAPPEIKDE